MDLAPLEQAVWWSNVILLVLLAARLSWNGLVTRYRSFFSLIVLIATRNLVLELLSGHTVAYFWVWLATEPLLVVTYILAVFELYSVALRRYAGIQTASRRLLVLALIIASCISVLSIFPDLQFNATSENELFMLVNVIRRGVYTSLLAFLVLLVSFITIFPVRLSRNAMLHVVIFTVSFLFFSAAILVVNLRGVDFVPVFNLVAGVVALFCGAAWCLFLTPAGEGVETSMPSRLSPEQAKRLLDKLKVVNDSLADSGKRM